jgi:hypothetical protein
MLNSRWPSQCRAGGRNGFYIKDQKSLDSDQYGLAPFDASKGVTKLTTWDASPSEAEVENIKTLLARIQGLKSAARGRLTGTQLMAFLIRLKRIYIFLYSMLVYAPFALCFVTLRGVFMHFLELTY